MSSTAGAGVLDVEGGHSWRARLRRFNAGAAAAALSALGSAKGEWTVVATIRPLNTWSMNVAIESGLRQVDRYSDDRGEMFVVAVAEAQARPILPESTRAGSSEIPP